MGIVEKIQKYGLEHFKRFYGVYPGIVRENEDPDDKGRVRVEVPSVIPTDGEPIPNWARPIFGGFTDGKNKGEYNVPRKGDNVWVMFRDGDPNHPCYISSGWLADGELPEEFKSVEDRGFKTQSGHVFRFRDKEGEESIYLKHTGDTYIEITPDKEVIIETNSGDSIKLDNNDTITAKNDTGSKIKITEDKISAENDTGSKTEIKGSNITSSNPEGSEVKLEGAKIEITAPSSALVKTPRATVDASSIKLGSAATSPAMKGQEFTSWLSNFVSWVGAHTHAPASPPVVPPPPPPIPTFLSPITKVE